MSSDPTTLETPLKGGRELLPRHLLHDAKPETGGRLQFGEPKTAQSRRVVGALVGRRHPRTPPWCPRECLVSRRRGPWKGIDDVEYATLEWVDWFNHRWLREPIGHVPPAEFEAAYYGEEVPSYTPGLKQPSLR